MKIRYETKDFPLKTVANGTRDLSVTWNDVLWAAITVGRRNVYHVFRHGNASFYEAIFRWSLVRMALEQRSKKARRIHRTMAYRVLDPTEKGSVSYFLGMTFCKLFADKLLKTPWLMHLDVYRPALNAVLRGRSRPDLIGKDTVSGHWHAFESKGRFVAPNRSDKAKAKAQAERLVSVNGANCCLHIGAITYFQRDTLQFFWRDPTPRGGKPIQLDCNPSLWRFYYAPFIEAVEMMGGWKQLRSAQHRLSIDAVDLEIGIHPKVAEFLQTENWARAQQIATEIKNELQESDYQSDGLKVVAGDSWTQPFTDQSGLEN